MTLAWFLACCGVLLAGGADASAAPAKVHPPKSFEVIDLPSDDGSAVLVVWTCPDNDVKGVQYAVEVAKSEADFASGGFKTQVVPLSSEVLASSKPECFGRSVENKRRYFAEISPAELFPPPDRPKLTPVRLNELAKTRVITAGELARALSVLQSTSPEAKLSAAEKAARKWYEDFAAYMETKGREAQEEQKAAINRATYYYRLAVLDGERKIYVERDGKPAIVSGAARPNFFKWGKLNNLLFSLAFCAIVFAFIEVAKRKPGLFIRKIAGLDAVDEAIGRSTEMNRPVFFVHGGSSAMGDLATIASVNILARVARKTAEHDTRIRVMNNDPIVTVVSQEVVQQAYTMAGRPDAYNPDDVALVASEQFSYVAAVSGAMVREQPGAIFLLGSFFAESLLLAETGASTGAIQIAGTDQYTQLPFFITTCDYTLIGEELYAASAYLSREPRQLGSLRGQDVGKAFLMVAIVVIVVVMTAAVAWKLDFSWLRDLLQPL